MLSHAQQRTQEIRIREYCSRKGLEVVGFFRDEAVSGAIPCIERGLQGYAEVRRGPRC